MNKVMVDKARLLRRVIVISWISLALCFVIKIFGGNFFEIISNNPHYNDLCKFIESTNIGKIFIGFLSSMLCQSLYLLAILQKYKFSIKEFILTALSVLICSIIQVILPKFSFISTIWLMLFLPILLLGRNYKKYIQVLIAWALTFLFQLISLLVKNISSFNASDTLFIGLIYMMDVYIMCLLYYLYRNFEKEKKQMGYLWVMFAGKPSDKLKAMREKRLAKISKLQAEVKAIEIELSKKKD